MAIGVILQFVQVFASGWATFGSALFFALLSFYWFICIYSLYDKTRSSTGGTFAWVFFCELRAHFLQANLIEYFVSNRFTMRASNAIKYNWKRMLKNSFYLQSTLLLNKLYTNDVTAHSILLKLPPLVTKIVKNFSFGMKIELWEINV